MILKDKKGMALIITLAIVSVLVVSAIEIGKILYNSAAYVKKDADSYQTYQIAISGINLAQIILSQDAQKNEIDSVQEAWADADKLGKAVSLLGYDKDVLTLKISDELGKIQVNALLKKFPGHDFNEDQRKIWKTLLGFLILSDKSSDIREPSEMINCIKDWMDSKDNDSVSGISGAESDYYLQLDPPYKCANAPFNNLTELFMVKGFEKDFFKIGRDEMPERILQFSDIGISDIFTIHGIDKQEFQNKRFTFKGKININTACEFVLASLLPPGREDEAKELVNFREMRSNDIFINNLDRGWYKRVIKLTKKEVNAFNRVIRYSSNIFKIEAKAKLNNTVVIVSAIVERRKTKKNKKWTTTVIRFDKG
jgi:general secretion pathway protein K